MRSPDMEFLEVLTEGLERVLLVRGGGSEVITIYSWWDKDGGKWAKRSGGHEPETGALKDMGPLQKRDRHCPQDVSSYQHPTPPPPPFQLFSIFTRPRQGFLFRTIQANEFPTSQAKTKTRHHVWVRESQFCFYRRGPTRLFRWRDSGAAVFVQNVFRSVFRTGWMSESKCFYYFSMKIKERKARLRR